MDDLDNLKYAELQKLAKKMGVKANQKADKIITAIRELSGNMSLPNVSDIATESEKESTTAATTTTDSEPEEKITKRKRKATKAKGRKAKKNQSIDHLTSDDEYLESAQNPKKIAAKSRTLTIAKHIGTPKGVNNTPKSVTTNTPKVLSAKSKQTPQGPRSSLITPRHTAIIRHASSLQTPRTLSSPGIPTPQTSTPRPLPSASKRKSTPRTRKSASDTPKTAPKPASTPGSAKIQEVTPELKANRRSKSMDVPRSAGKSNTKNDNSLISEDEEVIIKPRRTRSNTFTQDSPSADVRDILESMRDDMTQEEQKNSLMEALDRKAEKRSMQQGHISKTNIPRYNGLVVSKSDTSGETKEKTPKKDWSRIHKRQWDKMESLDEYLAKKRKRTESMTQSVKKLRLMTEQMKADMQNRKKPKTPASAAAKKIVSAGVRTSRSSTQTFQSPAPGVFRPTVLTTSKLDLNFGSMYGKEKSKSKTPILPSTRKSPRQSIPRSKNEPKPLFTIGTAGKTPTVRRPKVPASASKENLKSRKSVNRKSLTTPYKNTNVANTSQVTGSNKKFDIKESLAKPVTWQVHKGKLKPFSFGPLYSHETEVKEVKVKSREDRRKENNQRISSKRKDTQMSRRGLQA